MELNKTVTVAPGEEEIVTFEVRPEEAGVYNVSVEELAGSFTAVPGVVSDSWVTIGPILEARQEYLAKQQALYEERLAEYGPDSPLLDRVLERIARVELVIAGLEAAVSEGHTHVRVDDPRPGYGVPVEPLQFAKKTVGEPYEIIWNRPDILPSGDPWNFKQKLFDYHPDIVVIWEDTGDPAQGEDGWLYYYMDWTDELNTLKRVVNGNHYWITVWE